MAYTVVYPGALEVIDQECGFSIPAVNDNFRKINVIQCGIALFPTSDIITHGDPVFYTATSGPLTVSRTGSYGCAGIAVSGTTSSNVVSVQVIGQAALYASSTNYSNIGRCLYSPAGTSDVQLVSDYTSIYQQIGKITGVLSSNYYEVLIRAYHLTFTTLS